MFLNNTVVGLLQVYSGLIIFQPVLIHGILLVDFIGFLDFISRLGDTCITGVTCLACSFPYGIGITSSAASLLAFMNLSYLSVTVSSVSSRGWNLLRTSTLSLKVFVQSWASSNHTAFFLARSYSFWAWARFLQTDNPMVRSYASEGAITRHCVEKTILPLPAHGYIIQLALSSTRTSIFCQSSSGRGLSSRIIGKESIIVNWLFWKSQLSSRITGKT